MFVDSHCHLNFPDLVADLPGILSRMETENVTHALCIGVNLPDLPGVLSIAHDHPNIYASVGVHPDYEDEQEPTVEGLLALADDPKVVAIGETGLDYFRLEGDLEWQRDRFRTHIRAARQARKPLIIHTRAAPDDTIRVMREEGAGEVGGVMHCFTESWEMAQAALDQNFYISFSGIVTFKNAASIREVAKKVPMNRILIETDSPYLAPVPNRGKTNEPSWVRYVAEEIAKVKELPVEEVGRRTTENFFQLFKISP